MEKFEPSYMGACTYAKLCLILAILWTVAHQAPLSMGFSRQEYWRGLSCPPPGDLPNPGIESGSLALAGGFFTTSATWEALIHGSRDIKWCSCCGKQFGVTQPSYICIQENIMSTQSAVHEHSQQHYS